MDSNPLLDWVGKNVLIPIPAPPPPPPVPDISIDDMLLSNRVRAALKRRGFSSLEQVYSTPHSTLVSIRGIGASGIRELKETFEKDYNLPSRFL